MILIIQWLQNLSKVIKSLPDSKYKGRLYSLPLLQSMCDSRTGLRGWLGCQRGNIFSAERANVQADIAQFPGEQVYPTALAA